MLDLSTKINIQIEPTKFIAKIQRDEKFLIGSNGKLISNEYTNKVLPTFSGKFNSEKFLELKKNIDNSEFKLNELKSIFFFQSMRWDLKTTDDVLIKLPRKNLRNALKIAYKIIKDKQFKKVKIVLLSTSKLVISLR